ncbi:MAG: choice-of-anchor D domain-containing protein [Acidimicrobiia bacterium]
MSGRVDVQEQHARRWRRIGVAAVVAAAAVGAPLRAGPVAHAEAPGTTERVSLDVTGGQLDVPDGIAASFQPAISADGRFVAYATQAAADPDRDDNGFTEDIYVHDRVTGQTALMSVTPAGNAPSEGESVDPDISADGRYIVFSSDASELVPTDGNDASDVFVVDRGEPDATGAFPDTPASLELVSRGEVVPGGEFEPDLVFVPFSDDSTTPTISDDGTQIAFRNGPFFDDGNIYLVDRDPERTGTVGPITPEGTRNVFGMGGPDDGDLYLPSLSGDGDHLAFIAQDEVDEGIDHAPVFVYDRDVDGNGVRDEPGPGRRFVEVNAAQVDAEDDDAYSGQPVLDLDGSTLAYAYSSAGNGYVPQVYVIERDEDGTGTPRLVSRTPAGDPGDDSSQEPSITADGRYLAFATVATNLHPDAPGGDCFEQGSYCDVLLADLIGAPAGELELISVGVTLVGGLPGGDGDSTEPSISADGRAIAFSSRAENLLAGGADTNDDEDVFVRELTPGLVGSPDPTEFPPTQVGVTSTSRTVTFSHTGTGPLRVASVTLGGTHPGDFEVFPVDECTGATLHRGDTCAVGVRFTPTASAAPRTAVLSVAHDGAPSPTTVVLRGGVDVPPEAFAATPDPLDFGEQLLTSTSAPQVVTVRNAGPAGAGPLTVAAVGVVGPNAGDFAVTADGCTGAALAPGATCTVTVRFTPLAPPPPGPRQAALRFDASASGSPHFVGLIGDTPAPVVQVNPGVGVPGRVVEVTGVDWPPGQAVAITLDELGLEQAVATAAADGTFTTSVLVFPRSALGDRLVRAVAFAGLGDVEATTPYLVVAPTVDGGNNFVFRR